MKAALEMAVQESLSHPNIVRVFSCMTDMVEECGACTAQLRLVARFAHSAAFGLLLPLHSLQPQVHAPNFATAAAPAAAAPAMPKASSAAAVDYRHQSTPVLNCHVALNSSRSSSQHISLSAGALQRCYRPVRQEDFASGAAKQLCNLMVCAQHQSAAACLEH